MAGDDKYLLQMAYWTAFTNIQAIIKQQLPIDNCLDDLRKANIIDDEVQVKVAGRGKVEKNDIIVQHLQAVNDVSTYYSFIQVCDGADTELADRIRQQLAKEIKKVGLSEKYNPPERITNIENTGATNSTVGPNDDGVNGSKGTASAVKVNKVKWMQEWNDSLKTMQKFFVERINLSSDTLILDHMVQYGVLIGTQQQYLDSITIPAKRNQVFLAILNEKPHTDISIIIDAMKPTQPVLAEILKDLYDSTVKKCI